MRFKNPSLDEGGCKSREFPRGNSGGVAAGPMGEQNGKLLHQGALKEKGLGV